MNSTQRQAWIESEEVELKVLSDKLFELEQHPISNLEAHTKLLNQFIQKMYRYEKAVQRHKELQKEESEVE